MTPAYDDLKELCSNPLLNKSLRNDCDRISKDLMAQSPAEYCGQIEILHQSYKFNSNTYLVIIMLISTLIGIIFGLEQEANWSEWDTTYSFDFWTIGHFCLAIAITICVYLLSGSKYVAAITTLIVFTVFEIIEWQLAEHGYDPEFLAEVVGNRIVDLIVNTLGTIFAYYIIKINKYGE